MSVPVSWNPLWEADYYADDGDAEGDGDGVEQGHKDCVVPISLPRWPWPDVLSVGVGDVLLTCHCVC